MSHPIIRLIDRAKETTVTTGSGTISLGGAVASFVAISGVGDGNSTYYTIENGNNFEVGIGTYASAGNTLSRDEVFSSSNSDDSKINLSGSSSVFITYPALKAVVETSGNYVGIGGIDPEYQLQVSGTGSFNTVRWADGTIQTTAGTDTTYTAGTGLTLVGATFNTDGTGYFNYLGIGTDSPTYELDVAGDIGVDEYIYHNGDTNTYIRLRGDQFDFVAGGRTMLTLDEAGSDIVTVNDGAQDVDFQVKGDSDTNLIRTDAANDRVGIGTNDPDYKLEVVGTGSFNGVRWADGTIQVTSATGDISTVSGLTVTNASNIASTGGTNAAAILANTSNISTNTTNIASTGATNSAAILANTSNISTNTANISTNTTNIASTGATNAAAILANTSNISTNTLTSRPTRLTSRRLERPTLPRFWRTPATSRPTRLTSRPTRLTSRRLALRTLLTSIPYRDFYIATGQPPMEVLPLTSLQLKI